METLKGRGPADLEALSVTLAAEMLVRAGLCVDRRQAEARVRRALGSGEGLETFRRMVVRQGGDPRVVDDYRLLPSAPGSHLVRAKRPGYLASLDAFLIGRASMLLGAGRQTAADRVDPAVGILLRAKPGDRLAEGDPVVELQFRDAALLSGAIDLCERATDIGAAPPAARPLVLDQVPA
jgi:thymidine phosphorylase